MSASDHVNKDQSGYIFKDVLHDPSTNLRRLMRLQKGRDLPVAHVDYSTYKDDYGFDSDMEDRLDVDYLKSHEEGKGHARATMEELYKRYPKHFIDWGHTISPASEHLAQDFEDRYYNRTAYQTDEDF